jgi:hypothetical protein
VNQRQNRRGQYKVTQHASSIACRVRRRNSMCRRSTSERRGGHYRTIWMNPIKWRFCRACPSSLAYRPYVIDHLNPRFLNSKRKIDKETSVIFCAVGTEFSSFIHLL